MILAGLLITALALCLFVVAAAFPKRMPSLPAIDSRECRDVHFGAPTFLRASTDEVVDLQAAFEAKERELLEPSVLDIKRLLDEVESGRLTATEVRMRDEEYAGLHAPFDHPTSIDYHSTPTKHGEPSGDHDGGSDSGSSHESHE